ncbi:guanine-1-methyltransferase-domain-containing protein, partial [Microdochium bolleyi]
MLDKELVSMASQATRCYSDNRKARYRANFVVSSFGGEMRNRFEQVLSNQYKSWKGVHFVEEDFLEAADVDKSIVYLTADSPYTLDRLEPNTTYVIGGIIDRNREKGLCYRVARERNVRTAKLPIGEFMVLQSRHVLATNHVMEIMLKWLELGDWGAAFMQVIPTRKGGKLRGEGEEEEDDQEDQQVPQAPGGAAATDDEGNLADVEKGTAIEAEKPQEPAPASLEPSE